MMLFRCTVVLLSSKFSIRAASDDSSAVMNRFRFHFNSLRILNIHRELDQLVSEKPNIDR